MTVEELILIDKYKVRRDSNLMSLYLQYFKETFNYLPNCAGCSFASDWQKLVAKYSKKYVTLQKVNSMKTISIKKQQGKILSYKKDGKTFRLYDNILTDDFIKEYLINGTDEEIAERKKLFVFPVEEEKAVVSMDNAIPLVKENESVFVHEVSKDENTITHTEIIPGIVKVKKPRKSNK